MYITLLFPVRTRLYLRPASDVRGRPPTQPRASADVDSYRARLWPSAGMSAAESTMTSAAASKARQGGVRDQTSCLQHRPRTYPSIFPAVPRTLHGVGAKV